MLVAVGEFGPMVGHGPGVKLGRGSAVTRSVDGSYFKEMFPSTQRGGDGVRRATGKPHVFIDASDGSFSLHSEFQDQGRRDHCTRSE